MSLLTPLDRLELDEPDASDGNTDGAGDWSGCELALPVEVEASDGLFVAIALEEGPKVVAITWAKNAACKPMRQGLGRQTSDSMPPLCRFLSAITAKQYKTLGDTFETPTVAESSSSELQCVAIRRCDGCV